MDITKTPLFIRAVNARCKIILDEHLPEFLEWAKVVTLNLPLDSNGFIDWSSCRRRMQYAGYLDKEIDNYEKYQSMVRLDRSSPEYNQAKLEVTQYLKMALWAFGRVQLHNTVDQRRTNDIIVRVDQLIKRNEVFN